MDSYFINIEVTPLLNARIGPMLDLVYMPILLVSTSERSYGSVYKVNLKNKVDLKEAMFRFIKMT